MSWLRVTLPMPPPGREFLAVEALRRCGARAVERRGQRMDAWFAAHPDSADPPAVLDDLRAALYPLMSLAPGDLAWTRQAQEDWAGQRATEFVTRRVGRRIVVAAASPEVPVSPLQVVDGDVVIRLQPGAGFGSAEHPTTRACLRLVEELVQPGDCVLDIGAGTGILAIAAVLLGARRALALEADDVACEEARRNAALNGVTGRVTVEGRIVRAGDPALRAPVDVVLANLERSLLEELLPDLGGALARGGALAPGGALARGEALARGGALAPGGTLARGGALAPGGWLVVAGVTGGEWTAFLRTASAAGLEQRHAAEESGWKAAALQVAAD